MTALASNRHELATAVRVAELSGKRFLVTGAASGIGQAVADRFLSGGAEVHCLDQNPPTIDVTRHVEVDLSDPAGIDDALKQLDGEFDGLINVAGVAGTEPANLIVAVNALAVRHLTEAFLDRLVFGGSVVVVSSTGGFGWPRRLEAIQDLLTTESFEDGIAWFEKHPQSGNAYYFSKEVATVYTMSTALRMQQRGLRINAVLPGPVETPILVEFVASAGQGPLDKARALVGRLGQPDDIAGVVEFLVSDDARWVNGQTIAVDGGAAAAMAAGLLRQPRI